MILFANTRARETLRRGELKFVLLALAAASPATAIAKDPIEIGPEPAWDNAKAGAKEIIRNDAGLLDPWSAHWQWRRGGIVRTKKGWLICGSVNSKNQYGGYAGWHDFSVRVVNGKSDQYRLAPEGLGINACDITQGFEDEPD